jgi:pheromone shutdown protein TraB
LGLVGGLVFLSALAPTVADLLWYADRENHHGMLRAIVFRVIVLIGSVMTLGSAITLYRLDRNKGSNQTNK